VPNQPASLQFMGPWTDRVVYVADQFFRMRALSDEQPAPVFDLAIMIPNHARHVNIIDDHYFKEVTMTFDTGTTVLTETFASALAAWNENGGDRAIVDDRGTNEKMQVGGGWTTNP
jgi:hypothetical protein